MKRGVSLGVIASLLLASCGGGGGSSPTPSPIPSPTPSPTPTGVYEVPAQVALLPGEVQQIIAQGVHEARARGKPASFVVVDRVGNVLAVFVMIGADLTLRVPAPAQGAFDLQGMEFPAPAAVAGAIAKAVTGAYLSSSGNAFSTRTASMIVQEHFPPTAVARGLESGPLFGVQFSQLPCSDLNTRFNTFGGADTFIGPKRSPLGLSADAGGLPLYKNGIVVGGIGVMADGVYGFDPEIQDSERDDEEIIALAASTGYTPVDQIRADRITVDGTSLRYSDATTSDVASNPATAPSFASINGSVGNLITVAGYYASAQGVLGGRAYGSEASGFRASTPAEFSNSDAFILTNGAGTARFPIRAGTDAGLVSQPITQAEATALLEEAFLIMSRARAQIRRPLDSRAQVTISLVDTSGAVLGIVRAPDAPIFGTDVSLQKARTAAFFSHGQAAAQLDGNPSADVRAMMAAARTFFGDNSAFTGGFAFTNRAIGNIARPFFPDGEVGRPPGPFSRPIGSFNPFSTGLQSALIVGNVLEHVNFLFGRNPDTPQRCTATPDVTPGRNRLQNGIQIFPGSVAIYRGDQLIGGLGVSGDGIDQDDMISFLGLFNAGQRVGGIGHRDPARRSDQIVVPVGNGVRLRYVGCPFAPFVGSTEQNVCQGK